MKKITSEDILAQSSFPTAVFDEDGKVRFANLLISKLMGFMHPDEVYGRRYAEQQCQASHFATEFVAQDLKVLETGKRLYFLSAYHYADQQTHFLLGCKNLFKIGRWYGVIQQYIDVSDYFSPKRVATSLKISDILI